LVKDVEKGNIEVRENSQAVVEKVTGSAMFHRTVPRTGVTYWHRQTFTAWRIADGSALGRLHGIGSQGPFGGGVHCFTVRGNEAWIGFYAGDEERVVYVMDNGQGAGTPPDRSTGFPPLGITGLPDLDTYCDETPEIRAQSVFDLEAGNIQILP
jgi:hypothetical protein